MPRAAIVLLPYALDAIGARAYLGMTKAEWDAHLKAGRIPPANGAGKWRRTDLEAAFEQIAEGSGWEERAWRDALGA